MAAFLLGTITVSSSKSRLCSMSRKLIKKFKMTSWFSFFILCSLMWLNALSSIGNLKIELECALYSRVSFITSICNPILLCRVKTAIHRSQTLLRRLGRSYCQKTTNHEDSIDTNLVRNRVWRDELIMTDLLHFLQV